MYVRTNGTCKAEEMRKNGLLPLASNYMYVHVLPSKKNKSDVELESQEDSVVINDPDFHRYNALC